MTKAENCSRAKAWYRANKGRAKKRIREWQKENPEKVSEYRKRNRKVILEGQKRCYRRRKEYYKAESRAWANNNPARRKEIARVFARGKTLKRLGLSWEDFEYLLRSQQKKCAICLKRFKKRRGACLDHCHKSGKVRGLLCHGCNLALGNFKDSISSLRRAIRYLRRAR